MGRHRKRKKETEAVIRWGRRWLQGASSSSDDTNATTYKSTGDLTPGHQSSSDDPLARKHGRHALLPPGTGGARSRSGGARRYTGDGGSGSGGTLGEAGGVRPGAAVQLRVRRAGRGDRRLQGPVRDPQRRHRARQLQPDRGRRYASYRRVHRGPDQRLQRDRQQRTGGRRRRGAGVTTQTSRADAGRRRTSRTRRRRPGAIDPRRRSRFRRRGARYPVGAIKGETNDARAGDPASTIAAAATAAAAAGAATAAAGPTETVVEITDPAAAAATGAAAAAGTTICADNRTDGWTNRAATNQPPTDRPSRCSQGDSHVLHLSLRRVQCHVLLTFRLRRTP